MQCVRLKAKKDIVIIPELGNASVKISDVIVVSEKSYASMKKPYGLSFDLLGTCEKAKLRNGAYEYDKSASAVKDAAQALSPDMPKDPVESVQVVDKSMQAKTRVRRK